MPKKTVFEKRMDRDIASKAGSLQVLDAPTGMSFAVEVEFDKELLDDFGRDSILLADMNEEGQKIYKDLIQRIGDTLKKVDQSGIKLRDSNQLDDLKELVTTVNKEIEKATKATEERAAREVFNVWTDFQKKKSDYKKYKIKIGVDIAAAAASLAVNVALMATSAFTGGASAAFAIIGLFKSAVTIAKEIHSARKAVEESADDLEKHIDFIRRALLKAEEDNASLNARGSANEYAAAVTEQFLGLAAPNIKACDKELDIARDKLNGVVVGCHALSKGLNDILEKQETLRKDYMKEAEKVLSKHPSPKWREQLKDIEKALDDYLEPEARKVEGAIEAISKESERIAKVGNHIDKLAKDVDVLKACRGKGVAVLENLLLLADLALAPLDGNKVAKEAQTLATNFAQAGAPFAYERLKKKVNEGTWLE